MPLSFVKYYAYDCFAAFLIYLIISAFCDSFIVIFCMILHIISSESLIRFSFLYAVA